MTKSAEPKLIMQKHQKLLPIPHIASIEFAFDNFALSDWVQQILSLGLYHTVRDKINETLFLADIDTFLSDFKNYQSKITSQNL